VQISKKKLAPKVKKQVYDLLYKVIADIGNPQEVKEFLGSFLGDNEKEAISRRLAIAYLLKKGKTYAFIKDYLSVSSTTVASIAREMEKEKGFEVAFKKIRADEWAERWAKKITHVFKKSKK